VNEALNSITKLDIREFMGYLKPPAPVMHVMKAICIFLDLTPTSETDSCNLQDFWDAGIKQFRANPTGLLYCLMNYDNDNIPSSVLEHTESFTRNIAWAPEEIRRYSKVAEAFCIWVHGMHMYASAACKIILLKQELRMMENCLVQAEQALEASRARYRDAAQLQADHRKTDESNASAASAPIC
jgi:hypothetical protein